MSLFVYVSLSWYMSVSVSICVSLSLYMPEHVCIFVSLPLFVYVCVCDSFFVIHNGPRITSTAASPLASSCPEDAAPIAPVLLLDGAARRAGAAAATAADTTIG